MSDIEIDALYRIIGQRIAQARAEKESARLTQAELAGEVRLSRGSIANIELGTQRAPLHTLWQIARALRIEPRLLIPTQAELDEIVSTMSEAASLEPEDERILLSTGKLGSRLASWISGARAEISSVEGRRQRPKKRESK